MKPPVRVGWPKDSWAALGRDCAVFVGYTARFTISRCALWWLTHCDPYDPRNDFFAAREAAEQVRGEQS